MTFQFKSIARVSEVPEIRYDVHGTCSRPASAACTEYEGLTDREQAALVSARIRLFRLALSWKNRTASTLSIQSVS